MVCEVFNTNWLPGWRLHVFGRNRPAWALYEKLGYETTNVIIAKQLAQG